MPLKNRVDPFGAIHADPARGLFTGNRGVIHDPASRTLLKRRWSTRAWIVCEAEFRGRRREVMGRNAPGGGAGWTELFFLDEVTALAAGHRPCFYCRRERAKAFATAYADAFGLAAPRAAEIDAHLHRERLAAGAAPIPLAAADLANLPDGIMIAHAGHAYALRDGLLLPWSFAGYQQPKAFDDHGEGDLHLLTPPATVAVLRAGYAPVWHPTSAI